MADRGKIFQRWLPQKQRRVQGIWQQGMQIQILAGSQRCESTNALQRQNTEISKQIFPGKELRGYSPNSYIHVSVSDLYIPLIGLPILLQENRWAGRGNI
jgi:hypothetical protein